MAIRRFSTADLVGKKSFSFVGGYGAGESVMDSIQTVTVGAGGAASVTFSNIPQTYQNLQLRVVARTSGAQAAGNFFTMTFPGAGANYTYHDIYGDGASVVSQNLTSASTAYGQRLATTTQSANVFGVTIVDIFNYTGNTTKIVRAIGGWDSNGSGRVYLHSNLWNVTSAITSISLAFETSSSVVQNSIFSLYGIKG